MTEELSRRLRQEHAAYLAKRTAAVGALADALWTAATAAPMTGWTVKEHMPPGEKALFSTPAPPKLVTTLAWSSDVTDRVRALIRALRPDESNTEHTEDYEDEVMRALRKQLLLLFRGNPAYSIASKRTYHSAGNRLVVTVSFAFD